MIRATRHTCALRARRTALLRRSLVAHALRKGRFHGHVLRRVSQRVGCLPRPGRLRVTDPRPTLIDTMPSALTDWTCLGLGLAGGGGGSPGFDHAAQMQADGMEGNYLGDLPCRI